MTRLTLFSIAVVTLIGAGGCRKAGSGTPQTPPPAQPVAVPAALTGKVTVNPSPPEPMKETVIELHLQDSDGRPVSDREVSFDLTMPAMAMPPNQPKAQPVGDGLYRAKAIFTMAGEWQIQPRISGETNTDTFAVRLNTR